VDLLRKAILKAKTEWQASYCKERGAHLSPLVGGGLKEF